MLLAPAVPGCAQAPVSPVKRMQTVVASMPAASVMMAVTVSAAPGP